MSYVFISHASEDKKKVRSIVEALVIKGVKVWIDRPGHGENHFNFDQDFIEQYGIQGLKTGTDWDEQISNAIRGAGVVLVCISRALCSNRQVLVQELLLGKHYEKLVACIVDDLPFNEIPHDLGLADPSKMQAERIDTDILQKALNRQKKSPYIKIQKLPAAQKRQIEIINKLASEIGSILEKDKQRPLQQIIPSNAMREKVTLDQYNLLFDLQGRVERVMADLGRRRTGMHVKGLIVGNDIVPLSDFFIMLASKKALVTEHFYNILWEEGQVAIMYANAQNDEVASNIEKKYANLRENFHTRMNDVFNIDNVSKPKG